MGNFFKMNRNNTVGFLVSIFIFLIVALIFTFSILFEDAENSSISFRFRLRDPSQKPRKLEGGAQIYKKNPRAHNDIMIVGIDKDTIRTLGDEGIIWPFPWSVHARVARYLSSGNPNTIFFDIMFLDHKKEEKILADAFKDSGKIFVDFQFEHSEGDVKFNDIEERMEILNKTTFEVDSDDDQYPWVEEAVPPTPLISRSVAGLGYANVRPDADHVNRRLPLIIKYKGRYYPSIDLVVLMNYYGIEKKDVEIQIGEYIKLKNLNPEKMTKPNPEKEIKIPIDDHGFMDINFIGSHGSFSSVPYYYFNQDGKIEGDSFKNKIILIAAYSVSGVAMDTHDSPYGTLFGIEHHANAINTVLQQDFLKKLTTKQNLIIMLAIALMFGFFLPRLRIVFSISIAVGTIFIYSLLSYILFDVSNIIIAFTPVMTQTIASFTFIIAIRILTEQKEKKYIRSTFSKFVSKSVVDDLLKHPEKIKLGGEEKILTVLFSDIRGFTSISEKLTPEELVEHLNEYLQAMTDIVIKYNGTLDKYVGDEIMAFWGAPIAQDDHHLLACRAALEMMSVLHRLNTNWENIGKPPLDIGIGVNTGAMVVGNMGSNSRMDYTLMGDNVNLGARLEGTNKVYKTHVIISEFTYSYVKDNVFVRELDLIRVKGKEKPVKIYELIDVID